MNTGDRTAIRMRFSARVDGDFAVGSPDPSLDARRQRLAAGEWTWLRQVHGASVVVVDRPGAGAGADADAAVTDVPGAILAIHTADCVPVLLSDDAVGVIGAAHAGWRGLLDGVLGATIDAMGALGATDIRAVVGPHIRGRCYEFGADDLDAVAHGLGADVRATTGWGTPGLDLAAGVRAALAGRATVMEMAGCTACEPERYFSHRARRDVGRMAATIVVEA